MKRSTKRGVSAELRSEYRDLLQRCDNALYAPKDSVDLSGITKRIKPYPHENAPALQGEKLNAVAYHDENRTSGSGHVYPGLWSCFGASPELERSQSEFITAADAFQSGQYDKALELYSAIEERGHESADLFFNLGNTYTRLSKPGLAIKAYREALYRAPRSADLKANLEFVRGQTTDAIEPPTPATTATTLAFFHFQLSTGEKWGLSWLSTSYFGHRG